VRRRSDATVNAAPPNKKPIKAASQLKGRLTTSKIMPTVGCPSGKHNKLRPTIAHATNSNNADIWHARYDAEDANFIFYFRI